MTVMKKQQEPIYLPSADECPFFDSTLSSCSAALLAYKPEPKQVIFYCSCDDHDSCSLFLARALRSSAAGGLDREMAAFCGR